MMRLILRISSQLGKTRSPSHADLVRAVLKGAPEVFRNEDLEARFQDQSHSPDPIVAGYFEAAPF
jgi:hypothetical protein